jgi:UPF0716 protein FxsA
MGLILLLLLIGVPTLEIFVFIEVGGTVGLFNTLAIVFITAAIGAYLLRSQGLEVLHRVQQNLAANQLPVNELFDGAFLLIAGVLLLTPGFVTDGVGFLLFMPPFRMLLRHFIVRRLVNNGRTKMWTMVDPHTQEPRADPPANHPIGPGNIIIDGKFEEITPQSEGETKDENDDSNKRSSGNPWSPR